MIQRLLAVLHALRYAGPARLTVVRRYVDAQGRFVGELYVGDGRDARMAGMSCDTLPFEIGPGSPRATVEWDTDFASPMGENALRVGAMEPSENDAVRRKLSLLRYRRLELVVLNRFVEHMMGANNARG